MLFKPPKHIMCCVYIYTDIIINIFCTFLKINLLKYSSFVIHISLLDFKKKFSYTNIQILHALKSTSIMNMFVQSKFQKICNEYLRPKMETNSVRSGFKYFKTHLPRFTWQRSKSGRYAQNSVMPEGGQGNRNHGVSNLATRDVTSREREIQLEFSNMFGDGYSIVNDSPDFSTISHVE